MKERLYAQYGAVLRRAMTERGIKVKDLADELGISRSHLSDARNGYMMPNEHRTAQLATILDAPKLVKLREEARQGTCDHCGTAFVRPPQWLRRARFCSSICRGRWWGRETIERRKAELKATEPSRVFALTRKIYSLELHLDEAKEDRDRHRASVADFCRSCEWDGICKDAGCPLRDVSPLPLAKNAVA